MPTVSLLSRSDSPSNDSPTLSNPVYLVGIIVAAVIVVGVSVWLGLRLYRKRVAARREAKMGAAFLSVKGLVPESSLNEKADFAYAQ